MNIEMQNVGFRFNIFSNKCSLEKTYQLNQNKLWIADMSENKTNTSNYVRSVVISLENTQRITDPSEASNNFFFCTSRILGRVFVSVRQLG